MVWIGNIVVILTILSSGLSDKFLLLKDYIKSSGVTVVLYISCERDDTSFTKQTIKDLQFQGLWTNVWDISVERLFPNSNYHWFFNRYSHQPCIVIDLSCNGTKAFMSEMSKRIFFHHERSWFMLSESVNEAWEILNEENINFDAEIVLAIPAQQQSYNIYEVFNPSRSRGGTLNIAPMGRWSETFGWITLNQTKIERRHDLNGIKFPTVIPLANIPKNATLLEHLNSNELVHLDSMSRYTYRLFVLMMEKYNFKANLRLAHFWGMRDADGNWHGAVGALNRSQVDFCITGLRWANERYGVYEQTAAAYHAQFMFIFRHPKSVESWFVFLSPFDLTVWLVIILMGVCSAVVVRQIFSVQKLEIVESENISDDSFSNSVLMVFGFFFQQGYEGNAFLLSSRVLITTLLMFSVVLFQFYSSFIVGSLLTEAPKNIKTVKQLLNSRFEFGVDLVPYVLDNFHSATEEPTVDLYNKIMKKPGNVLMPLQTGLSLLRKGGFVFNTDGSYAYHVLKDMLTDSEKCDLQDILYLPKQPVGPGVASKSPFRELVKISICKFSETGISTYYKKIWLGARPKCEFSKVEFIPVDIAHFSSALSIIVAGMLTSTIIFLLEVMSNRWNFF